jgi:hypothetical protein
MKVCGSSSSRSSEIRAPLSEMSEIEHDRGGVSLSDQNARVVMELPPRLLTQLGVVTIIADDDHGKILARAVMPA